MCSIQLLYLMKNESTLLRSCQCEKLRLIRAGTSTCFAHAKARDNDGTRLTRPMENTRSTCS